MQLDLKSVSDIRPNRIFLSPILITCIVCCESCIVHFNFSEVIACITVAIHCHYNSHLFAPQLTTPGYLSKQEVSDYQNKVLDVNTESWLGLLLEETFPTSYCPLLVEDAEFFVRLYERLYKDKDTSVIKDIQWWEHLSADEKVLVDGMCERLQAVMDQYLQNGQATFVKLSSRSAKDAPVYRETFAGLLTSELRKTKLQRGGSEENHQITCLLMAAFQALKMTSAQQVLEVFQCSERIYQDMLLALEQKQRFRENFVVRQFVDIAVDMEFRGFVWQGKLTAISQYNYLIFSERLNSEKENIERTLRQYFSDVIKPKLSGSPFPDCFIIDFAICNSEEGKTYSSDI